MAFSRVKTWTKQMAAAISNVGKEKQGNFLEYAIIKIINYVIILCIVSSLVFLPVHIFITKQWVGALYCCSTIVWASYLAYLQAQKRYAVVNNALFLMGYLALAGGAIVFGTAAGYPIIFYCAVSILYLIFTDEPAWLLALRFLAMYLLYIATDFNLFSIFSGQIILSPSTHFYVSLCLKTISFFMTGITIHVAMRILSTINTEREKALTLVHEKQNDLTAMLKHLRQGIFSIAESGAVYPEYSDQLLKILEIDTLEGHDISSLFKLGSLLTSADSSIVASSVICSINEPLPVFLANHHHFPKKLTFQGKEAQKHLEFEWIPITDEDTVKKIMVTIRDNTELINAKNEQSHLEQNQTILSEIIRSNIDNFETNYKNLFTYVGNWQNSRGQGRDMIDLTRDLHTMKSEARFLSWKTLANSIHEIESSLKGSTLEKKEEDLMAAQEEIAACLVRYRNIFDSNLKGKYAISDTMKVKMLLSSFDHSVSKKRIEDYKKLQIEISKVFTHAYLGEILATCRSELESVAQILGKPNPDLVINDNDILFPRTQVSFFNKVFSHLITNAIDHGIEDPTVRITKGKTPKGKISIDVTTKSDPDKIYIHFRDDGAGLDLSKIAAKAGINKKETDHNAIAQAVFAHGITTKDTQNHYSGFGIGLNAVKHLIESRNGTIKIILEKPKQDLFSFSFEIQLPLPFF